MKSSAAVSSTRRQHARVASASTLPVASMPQKTPASATSTAAAPPSAASLAQHLHDWMQHEMQLGASPSSLPLPPAAFLSSTVRGPHIAALYAFLTTHVHSARRAQHIKDNVALAAASCSSSALPASSLPHTHAQLSASLSATQQEVQAAETRLGVLSASVATQHQQLRWLQAAEAERRRKALLLELYTQRARQRLTAMQRWEQQLQLTLSRSGQQSLQPLRQCEQCEQQEEDDSEADKENCSHELPTASATVTSIEKRSRSEGSASTLQQQLSHRAREGQLMLIAGIRSERARAAASSSSSTLLPLTPLLSAARDRHIRLSLATQRQHRQTRQLQQQTAQLLSSAVTAQSASLSSLHLVQRDIAGAAAALSFLSSLTSSSSPTHRDAETVKAEADSARKQVQEKTALLRQRRAEEQRLRSSKHAMQARWKDWRQELRSDRQDVLEPAIASTVQLLHEEAGCWMREWEAARDVAVEGCYEVKMPGLSSSSSSPAVLSLRLPLSASSVVAVQAPWPSLSPLLAAAPRPWYASADRLLPSLLQHHRAHVAACAISNQQLSSLCSLLDSSQPLQLVPALLASSAALSVTQAQQASSLSSLLSACQSLSLSVQDTRRLMRAVGEEEAVARLVPNAAAAAAGAASERGAKEWLDVLAGLEGKLRVAEAKRQTMLQAALALAEQRRREAEKKKTQKTEMMQSK